MINNELTSTPKTRHGIDPSTEAALAEVPASGQPEVDRAVAAARAAFASWRLQSWDARGACVAKLADAIEANLDAFRDLLVNESGKAVSTAVLELQFVLGHLRATSALRLPDEIIEDTAERTAAVRYRPLGVGVAIVPWNWPALLGVGKIGPAVMAGNTVIVKPSEYAPYVFCPRLPQMAPLLESHETRVGITWHTDSMHVDTRSSKLVSSRPRSSHPVSSRC